MTNYRTLFKSLTITTLVCLSLYGLVYWLSASLLVASLAVIPLYISLCLTILGGTLFFGVSLAATLYSAIIGFLSAYYMVRNITHNNIALSIVFALLAIIVFPFAVKSLKALRREMTGKTGPA